MFMEEILVGICVPMCVRNSADASIRVSIQLVNLSAISRNSKHNIS
jgi:hypothetical protein